ncbi:CRISPR-associated protein, Cas1 family [Bellilinea caldifistulae]|uniref:CRISPR-associated endonuclease Cas1 n=1 Tax=Bellilinea caldifistulae TaxID=360411 RepID=A0A0P6WQV7_9CHLR|nr:type I-C CRISPR-associated endonuclease Cas1c [Bellilinea caldifistulae]KPL71237.1 CRISPR-associated protein Cas1 [Bellilinea caldifistulae]GAP10219.1 CRISPR-associated protein, Cas1 family [Bellilinea caldifistulae]
MKTLANVLYITTPDTYLSLDGENIVIKKDEHTSTRLPLHNLENIVCFNWQGASPALMGACAERGIGLAFLSPNGRFLGRVSGKIKGNVLLRKKQYRISEEETPSVPIASSFLVGKVYNSRKVIERALRDHALLVDKVALSKASSFLKEILSALVTCKHIAELMAFEGSAAKIYFGVFDQLILQQKDDFHFVERSRRPPLDNMNSLLSFLYTLLTNEVVSALEAVGLDPYVGFLHTERPGRPSLALDMMEELRPVFADRLALSLVNRRQITAKGFTQKESGGILMDDETRKTVITAWQERKKEEIEHPYLKERIPFGLIPHVQALLLARHLRGDLDAYPPFFWS